MKSAALLFGALVILVVAVVAAYQAFDKPDTIVVVDKIHPAFLVLRAPLEGAWIGQGEESHFRLEFDRRSRRGAFVVEYSHNLATFRAILKLQRTAQELKDAEPTEEDVRLFLSGDADDGEIEIRGLATPGALSLNYVSKGAVPWARGFPVVLVKERERSEAQTRLAWEAKELLQQRE